MSEAVENQGIETGQDTELETKDLEDTGNEEVETQEEESTEEQTQDNGEFNPDELEFEEDIPTRFGDYDLSKYKEVINFENEQVIEMFNAKAQELKEAGFTQSQVEYLLDKEIEYAKQQQENKALSKEKVMEELNKSLTVQEKRDYKAVGSFLKEITKGDAQLEKCYNEAMSNPIVYKLLHKAFNKSLGGQPINHTIPREREDKNQGISIDTAINEYTNYLQQNLGNGEDRTPAINKILNKLSKEDKEKFKETFGIKGDDK